MTDHDPVEEGPEPRESLQAEIVQLRVKNEALEVALHRASAHADAQEKAGHMGLWELDLVTQRGRWSPKMFELYYLPPSDTAPSLESASTMLHPDDVERVQANMELLMRTGSAPTIDFRTHPSLGPVRHLRAAVTRVGDAQGTTVLGAVIDVTQQAEAEGELEVSTRLLEAVYRHSPYTIVVIDSARKISFVNRLSEGRDPSTVIGLRYDAGVCERDRPSSQNSIERIFAGSESEHGEVEDLVGHRWETRYAPLRGRDGEIKSVLCFTVDVTEQRKLEAQMQHAQKLESLGVLAGGIAHDFNNLLVSILGNAELALMELPRTSPARESLEEITTSSHRAADLCRQMLAYSGKGKFVVQPVALPELVQEMAHLLDVSISKQVVLRYEFAEDTAPIEADLTQIRQVVMNLITNASDAISPGEGIVTIVTGTGDYDSAYLSQAYLREDLRPGRYTFLEISDTGRGMDTETRERMFEPFFTSKDDGRGLGLSAVLGIVRSHDGAIRVYSEVDKGTTIKVLLPATDLEPDARGAQSDTELDWRGEGTILVVDDEPGVRTLAERTLRKAGFEVLTAPDGEVGLEIYAARGAEIRGVLLDMTMPRMDGKTTFAGLRRLDPGVCVLLSSGYNEQEATSRFAGKGLAGFIQKPYRPKDLVTAFRELLEPV